MESERQRRDRASGGKKLWGGRVALGLVLILSLGGAGVAEAEVGAGAVLYNNHCIACHGQRGDGRGPRAAGISPPPPNFSDPAFWKTVTDSYLLHVITNGLGPMPGWGETLSPLDIDNLLDYLKHFRKAGKAPKALKALKDGSVRPAP